MMAVRSAAVLQELWFAYYSPRGLSTLWLLHNVPGGFSRVWGLKGDLSATLKPPQSVLGNRNFWVKESLSICQKKNISSAAFSPNLEGFMRK